MPFSLGGLASGIDTGALIDGLMGVARQPIVQLDATKARLDGATQTITNLSTKLAALKTAALALSTPTGFSSFAASSSDTGVVATATGSASVGSYAINVTALARAQKSRSATFATNTTALGMAGSLDLQVGTGDPVAVSIVGTDSLSDIAAKISSSGARVSASVMYDGSTYRLLVQGSDSGVSNAFTITENSVAFGFGDVGSTYETAEDAALTIDGMAITSPTNQVNDAIGGLKLALTKVTTAPATVQVTSDSTALKTKVNAFITAYNDFVNASHTATGFAAQKAQNSELAADSSVRSALHRVGGLLSNPVAGASGSYTTLRSIGIIAKVDGTLSLDATKFDDVITADPDAVRRLMVKDTTTGSTGVMTTLMTTIDGLVKGAGSPIQSRLDALGARSKRLETMKEKMTDRLERYRELLRKQFLDMDTAIGRYQSMSTAVGGLSTNYYGNNR